MSRDRTDRRLSRRDFTRAGLGAAAAFVASGLLPRTIRAGHHESAEGAADVKLVTDFPENAGLLTAVKYVEVSQIEEKNCGNCQLLLERAGNIGRCGLFQKGKVPVSAYCTSWIQKSGA